MLSTVVAAESQFHLDIAQRDHERLVLAAIRERRDRLAERSPRVARAAAWPRPISVQPVACAA